MIYKHWIDPGSQCEVSNTFLLLVIIILFSTFYMTFDMTPFLTSSVDSYSREEYVSSIGSGSIQRRLSIILFAIFWAISLFKTKNSNFLSSNVLLKFVFLYIIFITLSIFWSEDYRLVFKRIVVFHILAFSAFATVKKIPIKYIPKIVFGVALIVMVFGFFVDYSAGLFSLTEASYRFAGNIHPNNQARNCAMLLLASVVLSKNSRFSSKIFFSTVVLVALFFLILTKSRGTFVAVAVAFFMYKFYAKKQTKIVALLFSCFLIFCLLFLILGEAFFSTLEAGIFLGRQETEISQLNGRSELWIECIDFAKERPFFGYGFQGFWTEQRVREISDSQGWDVHSSHSMYIEHILSLGIAGLGIFLIMVVIAWSTARRSYKEFNNIGMGFALSLLTLWLIGGLLARPLGGLDFVTYLFLVVLFGIARENNIKQGRESIPADPSNRGSVIN